MTRLPETVKTLAGILLADWDERAGAQVIAARLPGISEDPENLATQSYMTAQQVFCSAEFTRISYALPNIKIQRKGKFYFDVILDEKVRGGQRPFLCAVFLPLETEDNFFQILDPVIDKVIEEYKQGKRPDGEVLQKEIQKLWDGAKNQPPPQVQGEIGGQQAVLLKLHCEMCKRDIPVAVSKVELKKRPEGEGYEFTYLHGLGTPGVTPHGVRVILDPSYALSRIEYVDVKGTRISPFQDQDLQCMKEKPGTWLEAELRSLAQEMHHGTPLKTLARLFSRPITEIDRKMREISAQKLAHFNKVLGGSIAEAKQVEARNPKDAKQLWLKIAEYCVEFSKSPGIVPEVAANIRKKTQGIFARAEKL